MHLTIPAMLQTSLPSHLERWESMTWWGKELNIISTFHFSIQWLGRIKDTITHLQSSSKAFKLDQEKPPPSSANFIWLLPALESCPKFHLPSKQIFYPTWSCLRHPQTSTCWGPKGTKSPRYMHASLSLSLHKSWQRTESLSTETEQDSCEFWSLVCSTWAGQHVARHSPKASTIHLVFFVLSSKALTAASYSYEDSQAGRSY